MQTVMEIEWGTVDLNEGKTTLEKRTIDSLKELGYEKAKPSLWEKILNRLGISEPLIRMRNYGDNSEVKLDIRLRQANMLSREKDVVDVVVEAKYGNHKDRDWKAYPQPDYAVNFLSQSIERFRMLR